MKLKSQRLTVTTDASGDGTGTTPKPVTGKLIAVYWDKGTYDNGVDATFTHNNDQGDSVTILTLTNADSNKMYYPREQASDNTGTVLWYEAANSEMVAVPPLLRGRSVTTCTVSSGGATKAGGAIVYYAEEL